MLTGISSDWLWLFPFFLIGCAAQSVLIRPKPPFAAVVGPVIIAHRGGSLEAPENTLASIKHGIASGADWQELDVTLSKDGEVVVIHDDTLERTTNGKGYVSRYSLAELKTFSAGHPKWSEMEIDFLKQFKASTPDFGDKFDAERIPTLNECLKLPDAQLMIEMKKTKHVEELANKVVALVQQNQMSDRVVLGSFDSNLLHQAYLRDPSLALIGIAESIEEVEQHLELPVSALAVSKFIAQDALKLAPSGVAVWTWTIYHPSELKALVDAGIHGIITDVPIAVVKELRADPDYRVPLSEVGEGN